MIYLLSEKNFIELSFIGDNFNSKTIKYAIKTAQNMHLQDVIGGTLLKKLEDIVEDNSISTPSFAAYKTLLDDYITEAMVAFALMECVDVTHFKITNKSLTTQSSDNSEAVSFDEFKYSKSSLKNKAEFYGARLKDYLVVNYVLFPEYYSIDNIVDGKMQPAKSSYNCPMQFDDESDCCGEIGYGR